MDIKHLKHFIAVAKARNLNRAAKEIGIAQPALSRQIAGLEREVQSVLFVRKATGVALTEAGQSFLSDAERIVADVEKAKNRARQLNRGDGGALRIGFSELAASIEVFPSTVGEYRKSHPSVILKILLLDSFSQLNAIRSGELDIGFVFSALNSDPDVHFELIATYRWVVAMSFTHKLARKRKLKLADIADEDIVWCVNRTDAPRYQRPLVSALDAMDFSPRIVQEAESIDAQLSLLAAGMGVGFLSSARLQRPLHGVVARELVDFHTPLRFCMIYRSHDIPLQVQRFITTTRRIRDQHIKAS